MPDVGIASHYKVTTAAERRAALLRAQEERRRKEKDGCLSCLRGGGGGGGGGGKAKKKPKGKAKKLADTSKVKPLPPKKGKVKGKSRSDSDSDGSLGSDSDSDGEIDAAALMRKYGLNPDEDSVDVGTEEQQPKIVKFADEQADSDEYETDSDEEGERMDVIVEEAEEEEEEEEEEVEMGAPVELDRPPPPGPKPKRDKTSKSAKREKKPKKQKKEVVADSPPWSMEVAPSADEIRADLQELRLRPLKKRALAAGVTYEALDEAEDEDDYHGAIVELIVARETALASSGPRTDGAYAQALSTVDPNDIRRELQKLKLRDLKQRAKKTGVSSDELEDAEDNDDYKGAIVELVVAREVAAAASQTARGGKGAEPGSIPGLVSASAGAEGAASPKDAAKLYDRARTLRRQGSYDVAILAYTDSISAEHPDLAKCLNERGMCHGQLGQHNEAYQDYAAAVNLLDEPDASGAAVYFYNRGNAALQLGNVAECIQDLKKALQLQPGFAQAASALEELLVAVSAAENAQAADQQAVGRATSGPEPEPEHVPADKKSQAAIDTAIAEALAKQQHEIDQTKQQLQAAQEKLRAEEEYHRELSQAEKEAHAEALQEAEERAAADEVMQRLAAEKAQRKRARAEKREELAERERIDAAVHEQLTANGGAPSRPRGKKAGSGSRRSVEVSADMGTALETEIQRLQGEKSRRETERKEERARREEDHRLRAEKKSIRRGSRTHSKETATADGENADDFGREYKEKERQAVMAVKAAMAEKIAAQEAAELARLAEAEAAEKKKARAAKLNAERAERERVAVEAYNAALREKQRSNGSPKSLEGRKLEGRKPVKGISARSSAALGALLRQRTGEG